MGAERTTPTLGHQFRIRLAVVLLIAGLITCAASAFMLTEQVRQSAFSNAEAKAADGMRQMARSWGVDSLAELDVDEVVEVGSIGGFFGNTGVSLFTYNYGDIISDTDSLPIHEDAVAEGVMNKRQVGETSEFVLYRINGTLADGTEYLGGYAEAPNGLGTLVVAPLPEVYASRDVALVALLVCETLVFLVMFAAVSWMVKKLVIRRMRETNKTLKLITAGDLDQTVQVGGCREFERLSTGINDMVDALEEAHQRERARIEEELALASQIQAASLPHVYPAFPDGGGVELAALMVPAREVGGDFYDFYLVDETHLAVTIADVSGKGVPAAMFMMASKTLVSQLVGEGLNPAEALAEANRQLAAENKAGMFVTLWLGVIDLDSGRMSYANGGHNPPLLLRAGGSMIRLDQRSGLLLGLFPTAKYHPFELDLHQGDTLLLYTDGVTEAMDNNNQQYGEVRLHDALELVSVPTAGGILEAVEHDVRGFVGGADQADDITMLAARFVGLLPHDVRAIRVPAELGREQDVQDFVAGALVEWDCPRAVRSKLRLVVEELFVNIAHYAYGEGVGEAMVSLSCDDDGQGVTLTFEDSGVAFDPLASGKDAATSLDDATVGGYGIMMVKRMTDSQSYERTDGRNKLQVTKRWQASE